MSEYTPEELAAIERHMNRPAKDRLFGCIRNLEATLKAADFPQKDSAMRSIEAALSWEVLIPSIELPPIHGDEIADNITHQEIHARLGTMNSEHWKVLDIWEKDREPHRRALQDACGNLGHIFGMARLGIPGAGRRICVVCSTPEPQVIAAPEDVELAA